MLVKSNDRLLFTVIMEFAGTTSASQVLAADAKQASAVWANTLASGNNYGLSSADACRLRDSLVGHEDPTEITGLTNTWCVTTVSKGDLALLHIIKTVDHVFDG